MLKALLKCMILLFCLNNQGFPQSYDKSNSYAISAMKQAIGEYKRHERLPRKFHIIRMKIISLENTKGEFVLSTISFQLEYDTLSPSHYLDDDDGLILIQTDSAFLKKLDVLGFKQTNDSIRTAVKAVLAGPHPTIPGLFTTVTGQDPGYMIFNYKRRKVKGVYYIREPLPDKKYYF